VCVTAHGWNSVDGPPETSNCYCLPGRAGGSPAYARAIQIAQAYMRLDPFYSPLALVWSGFAHYCLKRYSEALPLLRESVLRSPNFRAGHIILAATCGQLGLLEEARAEAAEVLRISPKYTIDGTQRQLAVFKVPTMPSTISKGCVRQGCRKNNTLFSASMSQRPTPASPPRTCKQQSPKR
jgi:tetratricopeptide (TPR) repeat protein